MFQIDPLSRIPIYEQIAEQTEKLILLGLLLPGDPMPSVRSLSVELGTNPNTIQKAYSELDSRGTICSVPGKGCFISKDAKAVLEKRAKQRLGQLYTLCESLKLPGLTMEEMTDTVRQVFGKGDDNT